MIKVENIEVWGFEHAVRGMRNPMNSWDKSDSYYEPANFCDHNFVIGENDLDLMQRLYKSGTEHRTYARMIQVSMDIEAPLYWWKEMDRYTIGKSQVSCSTMHKIHSKEFMLDDFSHEHLSDSGLASLSILIYEMNVNRAYFIETKNKDYWWNMIQLLPSSYNQKRTVCMSYEVVFKIIRERSGHKLDEWNNLVEILKGLPYIREITKGAE